MRQPEIGLGDAGKGDSGERVSGFVSGLKGADRLIALAGFLARLSPGQLETLRKLRSAEQSSGR
jgi:hypothetical protein